MLLASAVLIETATSAGCHAMASDELGHEPEGRLGRLHGEGRHLWEPFRGQGKRGRNPLLRRERVLSEPRLPQGGRPCHHQFRQKRIASADRRAHRSEENRLPSRRRGRHRANAGSLQASNMAMLGFFSHFTIGPYTFENIVGAIGRKVAPRLFEMNRSVSEAGRDEAAQRLARSKVQA